MKRPIRHVKLCDRRPEAAATAPWLCAAHRALIEKPMAIAFCVVKIAGGCSSCTREPRRREGFRSSLYFRTPRQGLQGAQRGVQPCTTGAALELHYSCTRAALEAELGLR